MPSDSATRSATIRRTSRMCVGQLGAQLRFALGLGQRLDVGLQQRTLRSGIASITAAHVVQARCTGVASGSAITMSASRRAQSANASSMAWFSNSAFEPKW